MLALILIGWARALPSADGAPRPAADPLGYTGGAGPLVLDGRTDGGPGWMSAADCGDCHEQALAEWTDSRHHRSWTNDLFQAGLIAEPQRFCVYCHAPAAVQAAEVIPNLAAYAALSPRAAGAGAPRLAPEPLAEEGVSCAVCHLRDGAVLAARPLAPGRAAPHPIRVAPELGGAEGCRGCHEFAIPAATGGPGPFLMQSTYSEWRALSGPGDPSCVGCHMAPGHGHRMTGAHDLEKLRGALRVRRAGGALVLEAVEIGHALPTGDLFRALTVELRRGPGVPPDSAEDDGWEVIFVAGRSFELVETGGPRPEKRPLSDTRLWPGQPRSVALPLDQPEAWWRVRYMYGAPHDLARGLAPLGDWVITLASGQVGQETRK